jgi:hypothetical protein
MLMPDPYGQDPPGPLERTVPQDTMPEFAGYVVNRLSFISLSLESALSMAGQGPAGDQIAAVTGEVDNLPQDVTRLRITEALHWLDDLAGQIRDHVFNESSHGQRRV